MIHLTPRLQAVADFVSKGSVIADIGTDHAYLPAFLIEQGVIETAFACDIREGPLQNARNTAEKESIEGISFLLSDGLEKLQGKAIDEIVIAGMGGEMIAMILSESPWCRNKSYSFVLQPMTKVAFLRRFLYREGFEITKEALASEKDKIYNIFNVRFSGKRCDISEAFALLGKTRESALFEQKKYNEIVRLKKIAASLEHKQDADDEIKRIMKIIKEVEEY